MIESRETGNARADSAALMAAMLRLARPQQWVKNAVVLAGVVFAEATGHPIAMANAITAMVAFVLASVSIYVFNDLRDADADRHHPLKRNRPIASGTVSREAAGRFGFLTGGVAILMGTLVTPALGLIIGGYLLLMVCYTLWLKQVAILDVTTIAVGFVMRAVGGAVAVAVPISPWLLVCAFLLALFLGFGKRRAELIVLGGAASRHRLSLQGYTAPLLDQLVGITAISALVTYAVYTVVASNLPANDSMLLTVPPVAFAILRYLYLVYGRGLGGSPESLLFRDRWLLASVLLWGAIAMVIVRTGGEITLLP